MNHKTPNFRRSALARSALMACSAMAAVLAVPQALAQDASQQLKRVEVTGSRILSLNAESPAPVQVMNAADIAASGAANVQEILLKNPVFGTPTISRNNSNFQNESAGVATVDLRNLGIDRTLVLVNGRRYVSGIPGSSAVDLNTIPADFIDRIEILTGGASSTYGSDAVAGVVNIILKRGFEGLALDAQAGRSSQGDDSKQKISLTAGTNLAEGRGNLMVHFSASKQGAVYSRDREASAVDQYTKADAETGDPADLFTAYRPFYSSYAPQGRFFYTDSVGASKNLTFDANGNAIPFSTNGPNGDGVGATGYNRSAMRTISIPTDRMLLSMKGDMNLAGSHSAFFEGTYANTKTQTRLEPFPLASSDIAPGTGGLIPGQTLVNGIKVRNPLLPDSLYSRLTDSDGDGLVDYSFTRRMSDIANRGAAADRDTFRILGGFKGDLTNTWSYETYMSYGFTKEGQTSTGQVNTMNFWNALQAVPDEFGIPVCADATARAMGCAPANVFGANTLSSAAAAYINAPASLNTKVTQQLVGFVVNGEPFNMPAGPVGIAAGAEYRRETSKTEHDALTISGLNGGNALPDTAGSFNVKELFVEGRMPLFKNAPFAKTLDGTIALRRGDYSTVGNTNSWNAGLDWAINSTFRVRATSSVSTRAPNINELYQGQSQTFPTGLIDPCSGITSASTGALADNCRVHPGVNANMAANNGTFTLGQADMQGVSGYDGGNPDLKAEKGKSKTIGLVITPKTVPMLRNFSFTADYYDISIDDAINLPGRQYLLDQCYRLGDAASCKFITRRTSASGGYSAGSLDLINQGVVNSGGETARGVDITVGYGDKIGPGQLNARLSYTHLLKAEQRATATADSDSSLGEIGNPKNKWMLNLGYDYGKFAIKSTITYIGKSYLDDQYMNSSGYPYEAGKVSAVTYLDLQTTYSINKKSQLYFGIDNLFDKKAPPIISGLPGNSTGTETDAGTYDPIGRRFYVGLRYSL
ncbi:MAG: TonB-dependent receptor [Rhodoferax sp.]|uniref:TonB-dependent receptor domain-containing protein n=1 Tax=Rhodoferax sp. TaxID=50421 RepID=UPI001B756D1F|nr:TonB-dependent receptor [Rhodoferax sp.]MBP9736146.1 TonB-dependent receptor [Rhodoferax sp.]